MKFDKYTEIMFKGSYDHPVICSFPKTGNSLTIEGVGGNRRLCVADKFGGVKLLVDFHLYGGDDKAYIVPGAGIILYGKPSATLVRRVYNILISNMRMYNGSMHYNERGLNNLFKELYNSCKSGSLNP